MAKDVAVGVALVGVALLLSRAGCALVSWGFR